VSNVSCFPASAVTKVTGGPSDPIGSADGVSNLGRFDPTAPAAARTFAAVMRALVGALDAKDADTWQHSSRVSAVSVAMARVLGLDDRMQSELRIAGELHDVGKIGVPVELLRRPGRLTAAEYRAVLLHTVIGERMLRPLMRRHPQVLQAVRSHHERFAGGGFPDGLHGYAIPLAARIVAVADAFDAMTSSRPYRAALGVTAAVRELRASAGTQFDPACVRALLIVLRVQGRVGRPRAVPTRRATRCGEPRPRRGMMSVAARGRRARWLSGPARADPDWRRPRWLASDHRRPSAATPCIAAPARAGPHCRRGAS